MEILKLINNGSKHLKSKNIYSYKLDSEILLSEALSQTREKTLINLNKRIEPKKLMTFIDLLKEGLQKNR